jgi:hypothetical protein
MLARDCVCHHLATMNLRRLAPIDRCMLTDLGIAMHGYLEIACADPLLHNIFELGSDLFLLIHTHLPVSLLTTAQLSPCGQAKEPRCWRCFAGPVGYGRSVGKLEAEPAVASRSKEDDRENRGRSRALRSEHHSPNVRRPPRGRLRPLELG